MALSFMIVQRLSSFLKVLQKACIQYPDLIFFAFYLVSMTFSVRKVIIVFSQEGFNEFQSISLFASDIFLLGTLVGWVYIKKNLLTKMSINVFIKSSFQKSNLSKKYFIQAIFLSTFFFLSCLSFFSLNGTYDSLLLFIVKIVRLGMFLLLFWYLRDRFHLGLWNIQYLHGKQSIPLEPFLVSIVVVGLCHMFVGVVQTFVGSSLGLTWAKESIVGLSDPGVAKVVIFDRVFLRSYGLFPHPNVFAWFLYALVWFTGVILMSSCSIWNTLDRQTHFLRNFSLTLLVFLCLFSFVTSFSRAIWIALMIFFLFTLGHLIKKMYYYGIFLTFGICAVFVSQGTISLQERLWYESIAIGIVKEYPMLGVGLGNFVNRMGEKSDFLLASWQYQPVHSVPLLIAAEIGVGGAVVFFIFFLSLFSFSTHRSKKNTTALSLTDMNNGFLLGLLFMLFFDHYMWDIVSACGIFWLSVGINSVRKLTNI